MVLEPYVFYYGRCEEALEFYKSVFGGSYDIMRNTDAPPGAPLTDEWKNKVMHSTFKAPGFQFMLSDGRPPAKKIDPEQGNISLSIGADSEAEGARIVNALGAGGNIDMPFEDAFWGGKFGQVTDKFGVEWMVVSGGPGSN
jgi:PhnB protein